MKTLMLNLPEFAEDTMFPCCLPAVAKKMSKGKGTTPGKILSEMNLMDLQIMQELSVRYLGIKPALIEEPDGLRKMPIESVRIGMAGQFYLQLLLQAEGLIVNSVQSSNHQAVSELLGLFWTKVVIASKEGDLKVDINKISLDTSVLDCSEPPSVASTDSARSANAMASVQSWWKMFGTLKQIISDADKMSSKNKNMFLAGFSIQDAIPFFMLPLVELGDGETTMSSSHQPRSTGNEKMDEVVARLKKLKKS